MKADVLKYRLAQRKQKLSKRSEQNGARELNGRTTIASGALPIQKGDIITERFLCEDKMTVKKSFSVTKGILDKISRQALNAGKHPLLRVTVQGTVYYVLPQNTMIEIINND